MDLVIKDDVRKFGEHGHLPIKRDGEREGIEIGLKGAYDSAISPFETSHHRTHE